jgi:hypothetical protein
MRLVAEPTFHLSKWYFDGTSAAGDLWIGYCATVRFHGLGLSYAALLLRDPAGSISSRSVLVSEAAPEETEDLWTWRHRALGLDVAYERLCPPVEKILLDGPAGSVIWRCRQPLAHTRLQLGERAARGERGAAKERQITGLGYVEHLEMTLPPWKLPCRLLRWGRFTAPSASIVWIGWEGPHPVTLVLQDGRQVSPATVADTRIDLPEARLDLRNVQVLRSGPLASKALASIPGISRLFPAAILRTEETKWYALGRLESGQGAIEGDVIHETVRFGEGDA